VQTLRAFAVQVLVDGGAQPAAAQAAVDARLDDLAAVAREAVQANYLRGDDVHDAVRAWVVANL
jgi:flagellar biosynthesis/type III secretory pathway M-ring protein FliF/YscJ